MILAFLILFFHTQGMAGVGGVDGNGGDGITCQNAAGKTISVELYDYYEARVKKEMLELPSGSSETEILNKMFTRLQKWSPTRANKYREAYKNFLLNVKYDKGSNFPDILDSGVIELPLGCQVKQIAYQTKENGITKYFINEDLWKDADLTTRAGTIFHELIYDEFKDWEIKESKSVRSFHRLIFSPEYAAFKTQKEWFEALSLIGVIATDICGGFYTATDRSGSSFRNFDENGWVINADTRWVRLNDKKSGGDPKYYELPTPLVSIAGAKFNYGKVSCWNTNQIKTFTSEKQDVTRVFFKSGNTVTEHTLGGIYFLYPSGNLHQMDFRQNRDGFLKIYISNSEIIAESATFYPNGNLNRLTLKENNEFIVQGKKIIINNEISFYENGQPLTTTLVEDASLLTCGGSLLKVKAQDLLLFSSSGCLLNVN